MASKPSATGGAISSTIENVLDKILRTRLQRRAKSVILSGLEFLLVDLAILLTAINTGQNKDIELGLFILSIIGASYVLVLIVFLTIHAWCFTPNGTIKVKPKAEVENAYAQTNGLPPLLDGLLELPFPAKFRGNGCAWFLPYITWSISAGILISGVVLYVIIMNDMNATASAALGAAAVLLYQISSDFSEYWVFSGNQELQGGDIFDDVI